ncbi:MAG TPA: carboxylating nicotinate-nucleotide diphosphorylase [Bacteroidia bacterium]|nr:carboxylating nicotinate-nucleotide diphosphorylase [Bacteroidia bacterium]
MNLTAFIRSSLAEDIGNGDYTSLACIPATATGEAHLLVKDTGIIAGVDLAKAIFEELDPGVQFTVKISDGSPVKPGDIVFSVSGRDRSLLAGERLLLNCMQRMSGIATTTRKYVDRLNGLSTKVLDTRKTTPLLRDIEKWAVRIGGGMNHRMGLYDMILVKDNHVDYAGGIKEAINRVNSYRAANNLNIPFEIETRNLDEVRMVLETGNVDRIMLDNFALPDLRAAVQLINRAYETEASGGITLETVRAYAETGVDFVSVGALTHSVKSLDLSLKAAR